MSEHPTREELMDFLGDRLPPAPAKNVVAHLVGRCASCRRQLAPQTSVVFQPGHAGSELRREREQGYETPIRAAFAAVRERAQRLESEREEGGRKAAWLIAGGLRPEDEGLPEEPGFWTWGLCEDLIEKSWSLRQSDPAGMVHLADLAREAAERLDPELYGAPWLADLQARAWGELSNAYRTADDLQRAELAMVRALELRRQGSGVPLLRAHLAELSASLLGNQRRFAAALRMLDLAHSIYKQHGEPHDTGRVLIRKGLAVGRGGDPEQGILFLGSGLATIDPRREPLLIFQTLHNILLFKVELGEYRQAGVQLWQMRPLYDRYAGRIELLKLRGLEGKIAAGLGNLERAERAFLQVVEGFEAAGLAYDAALTGLDLAAVWLRQGQTAEVLRLVGEMVSTFRARKIQREALAALLMLRDALEGNRATVELLEVVSGVLQRVQDGPARVRS
jgi:tetratricopeptide (TPR) repeat protein